MESFAMLRPTPHALSANANMNFCRFAFCGLAFGLLAST